MSQGKLNFARLKQRACVVNLKFIRAKAVKFAANSTANFKER